MWTQWLNQNCLQGVRVYQKDNSLIGPEWKANSKQLKAPSNTSGERTKYCWVMPSLWWHMVALTGMKRLVRIEWGIKSAPSVGNLLQSLLGLRISRNLQPGRLRSGFRTWCRNVLEWPEHGSSGSLIWLCFRGATKKNGIKVCRASTKYRIYGLCTDANIFQFLVFSKFANIMCAKTEYFLNLAFTHEPNSPPSPTLGMVSKFFLYTVMEVLYILTQIWLWRSAQTLCLHCSPDMQTGWTSAQWSARAKVSVYLSTFMDTFTLPFWITVCYLVAKYVPL